MSKGTLLKLNATVLKMIVNWICFYRICFYIGQEKNGWKEKMINVRINLSKVFSSKTVSFMKFFQLMISQSKMKTRHSFIFYLLRKHLKNLHQLYRSLEKCMNVIAVLVNLLLNQNFTLLMKHYLPSISSTFKGAHFSYEFFAKAKS